MAARYRVSRSLAVVCLVVATVVATLSVGLSIALVNEYGPAEGYGSLLVQVLPIGGLGLVVAAALIWLAVRLLRGTTPAAT